MFKEIIIILGFLNNLSFEEIDLKDIDWVARNIYFEARQSDATFEQRAHVAQVVKNRLDNRFWGKTYKSVITYNCDFSWYCDENTDIVSNYMTNEYEFQSATYSYIIAMGVIKGGYTGISNNALYYHASDINTPRFFKKLHFLFDDGLHKFYK